MASATNRTGMGGAGYVLFRMIAAICRVFQAIYQVTSEMAESRQALSAAEEKYCK